MRCFTGQISPVLGFGMLWTPIELEASGAYRAVLELKQEKKRVW